MIEFEDSIDLFTDSSIEKFVTSTIPFNDMNYIPENLISISSEYISDLK
ncbi:MAG: hypothetical protein LBD88_02770 [Candidatus Peribacteria bacterium]|jgi:hypothetical protein|nr:hypothetical protein [Candidatus Peribacteria bacterium]